MARLFTITMASVTFAVGNKLSAPDAASATGYVLGIGWAEAVQIALESSITGETRELLNDCLAGAWVNTITPEANGFLPQPRTEGRTVSLSPGDADATVWGCDLSDTYVRFNADYTT